MIVAIEGAPGVGKSTLAASLAASLPGSSATVIAEVNLLFARPQPEPADWYNDRQTARWEMAALVDARNELAILDGDPLQPVWFNRMFGDAGASWLDAWQFFHARIIAGRMALPTHYVIAHVDEATRNARLLTRERSRGLGEERAQRKVERYRTFADTQLPYWRALAAQFPGWVHFVETTDLALATATLRELAARAEAKPPAALDAMAFIEAWLSNYLVERALSQA